MHGASFEVTHLVPGTYSARLASPDVSTEAEVTIRGGETSQVRFRLDKLGSITGRAIAAGGKPPTGAPQVMALMPDSRAALGALAPDGTFQLAKIQPGSVRVQIACPREPPSAERTIQVEPGRVADLGQWSVPDCVQRVSPH